MTLIMGARCVDGVVLIADKKVTYMSNGEISGFDFQNKLFDDLGHIYYTGIYGKNKVDLEAIMSVIIGLKEERRIRDNIGELGLFGLAKKGGISSSDFSYDNNALNRLEVEYKSHVRANVVIKKTRRIDFSREVYTDFFKQICNVTTCNNANGPD